ncbi:MAG: glutamate 5-kinase [Spirochaetes bacterium]|nr:glutamate 5-kinase [Spirochaetota bacterium]
MPRKSLLRNVKTVVVKIGSSSITERGRLSQKRMAQFVGGVAALVRMGYRVTVVSSGAIAAGTAAMKRERKTLTIPEKQAFAALGQTLLMNEYRKHFLKQGYQVGQILLTEDDVKHRRRFLNARHTLHALLELGIVPIVNENDSVVVKEIKFGDNDTLSAHVASIIDAELLVLLSDIDGFYWSLSDPKPVDRITEITDDVLRRAGGTGSDFGTGGMTTKIAAARMILQFGEMMVIANGAEENVLVRIMEGERIGTLFAGGIKHVSSKKKWLAMVKRKGTIEVDDGAVEALVARKKSLLARGIVRIEGSFDMGDIVEIVNRQRKVIGKGVVNYSSRELHKIIGKRSDEIQTILGIEYFDEVINRDDMLVF